MTLSPSSGRLLPCPSAGGHFPTFFRTAAAGLGAAAAMVVLVLFAFRGTGVANRGADAAELRDESGIPAHECRAGPALVRAIDAEPRAFRHLAETLIAARFAFLRASDTGFHTGLILMSHERISFMLIGAAKQTSSSQRPYDLETRTVENDGGVAIELPTLMSCSTRCARRKADHNRRTTSLARTSSTGRPILSLSERRESAIQSEGHISDTEMVSPKDVLSVSSHEKS